jgi:hypothetical protein
MWYIIFKFRKYLNCILSLKHLKYLNICMVQHFFNVIENI